MGWRSTLSEWRAFRREERFQVPRNFAHSPRDKNRLPGRDSEISGPVPEQKRFQIEKFEDDKWARTLALPEDLLSSRMQERSSLRRVMLARVVKGSRLGRNTCREPMLLVHTT